MTAVKSGQYACVECPSSLSRVWIGTGTRVLNGGGGNCAPGYELLTWGRVGHLGDSRLPEVTCRMCVCTFFSLSRHQILETFFVVTRLK